MATLQIVPRIPERPAHLIRIAVPRLNKCDWIEEYLKQLKTRDYDLNWAEVSEVKTLTCAEWNELMRGLLTDRDWLAGKGGASSWAVTLPDTDRDGWLSLTEDQRELFKRTSYLHVIEVRCAGAVIYIDPEGYNYARYVAFPAPEGMPEGKTEQEREKERQQSAIAERKARIAHEIANPPEVPADHGLRFYWNGIKANGGELQKAYYSLGNLYDYPEDTLSINARGYRGFSKEVSACFRITNNSDLQTDYFDHDHIRVCSNHPLYALVMAAYEAQERHNAIRRAKLDAKYGRPMNVAHVLNTVAQ